MVKNVTGGNKHKKYKNKNSVKVESQIVLAGENQVYGLVTKILGGKHISVTCSDGEIRTCTIEGKHYKKLWIRPNDVILCNVETIGLKKICYLVRKYSLDHVAILRGLKLLTFLDKDYQDILAANENSDDERIDIDNCSSSDSELSNYYDVDINEKPSTKTALLDADDDNNHSVDNFGNYRDNFDNVGKNNKNYGEDDIFCL